MATITYEDMNTLIENTTMQKIFRDGVHRQYRISPVDSYVLHDKRNDWTEEDPETLEERTVLGYVSGSTTCPASYDFVTNPWEFYAVPEDSVPADHIFGGGGNNDHEIM